MKATITRSSTIAGRIGSGVKVGIRMPKVSSTTRMAMCSALNATTVAVAAPAPSARTAITRMAGRQSARRNG